MQKSKEHLCSAGFQNIRGRWVDQDKDTGSNSWWTEAVQRGNS